ncbi:MAG: ATP-binding protein [Bacteroidetes bacterium]|nr:MAG: ATP-binding protein [Bacteroidota bacterium]
MPPKKSTIKKYEVPVKKLRWHCDPKSLGIQTTEDIESSRDIIGQERALRALRLGLEIHNAGYNVFVTGYSGTGRMTTIKRLLSEFEGKDVPLRDQCYVHNIKNPDEPILVTLPSGQGVYLRAEMEDLLHELVKIIPAALESQRYQDKRRGVLEHFQERQKSVLRDFEKKVKEKGFEVVQVQVGSGVQPEIAPVVGNQPVSFDQLENLVTQGQITREEVEQKIKERMLLEKAMEVMLREMRNIDRKAKESIDDLTKKHFEPIVKLHADEVRAKFDNEKLQRYLDSLVEHVVNNLQKFRPQDGESQPPGLEQSEQQEQDSFVEFRVNIVLDNSETKGIPIVIETNPKYKNMFGTIEREVDRNGVWRTDFTMIKSGSMLRADGGYLVVNALDALVEPGVWQTLKRTLRNGLLEIQPMESGLFGISSALKPEPVAINVKVIMIGDAYIYFLLYEQDDDFKKIFKVRADFDVEMPKQEISIKRYVSFIKMICDEDKLRHFDAAGIAAVIEYGTRLAGRQDKLSTRFNIIADVLREASYWAVKEDVPIATASHIWKAIDERIERVNLVEEKIQEMILDGSIMIDTDGWAVGQVNGLSVYDLGEYMFGKPSRITAKTSLGREGLINIEREADMSGPTHNKGVLILNGYLHSKYAVDKPLVMTASIAFEQSYSGVDGDSASSTEIYALLSSLANLPLRQDIAVTGSVNQKGEIQPIGGVNQKIEGYFDVCKARGLTGKQGVIIPHQNVSELMLRNDVVDEVKAGKFSIFAVKTIDEGIEILTGKKAGKQLKSGTFEPGSVHAIVNKTLIRYAKRWKELSA